MKFVYTQDIHLKKKNPVNRVDNYFESVITKLEEVCQIYQKQKCDLWIDGGDLLEIPLVSYGLIDDFIDLLEKYNVKMKLLFGNHSMVAANVENSSTTSLAHILRRSKNIEILNEIETEDEIIKGYDYYFGIEDDINENGLICEESKKTKIGIVHALITEKPFFAHIPHCVVGKFKTNYDYLLIAHNHKAWKTKEIDGTKRINIGCLGRRKTDERTIEPSCLIYETGKPIIIQKLKTAKIGSELFDLTKHEEKKEFSQSIDGFVEMINDVKFKQMDTMNAIQMVAKENKIDKDIVNCIVEKIGEIENEQNKN